MDSGHNGGGSLRDTLRGKHLLVTGVTGFVAKVWVAMLLDRIPELGRITLLIRSTRKESAADRFETAYRSSPVFRPLRERLGTALYDLIDAKVVVIDADITKPLAGFDRPAATELMRTVDAVVHFAGLTDFEPDPVLAIQANIDGAMHVGDLAALTPSRRLIHCSTAFVAGVREGEIDERLEPGVSPNGTRFDAAKEVQTLRAALSGLSTKRTRIDYGMERAAALGWPNIYTVTKGLAEHLLAGREDIEVSIARPSIVECALEYPFAGWNEGINTSGPIVWLLSTPFRRLPSRAHNHFDVVPVDLVARGVTLVLGAALHGRAERVYHLTSGDLNPLHFGRAIELVGLAARRTHRKSDDWVERWITSRLDSVAVCADKPQVLGAERLMRGVKETRDLLKRVDLEENLSPRTYRRWGARLESKLRSLRSKLRNGERKLSSIDEMLKQYRPFIFDHDYIFQSDHVVAESQRLPEREREHYDYDVTRVEWRSYWLEVQVPGLQKWSIPELEGKPLPEEVPLPPRERATHVARVSEPEVRA